MAFRTDWQGNIYPDTDEGAQACNAWSAANPKPVPPLPPPPPPPPPTCTPLAFVRRFTPTELAKFLATEAAARALTPADYSDPAKAGLVRFQAFKFTFDQVPLDGALHLEDPDVIAAVTQLFPALGIVTAQRAADVLNPPPPPPAPPIGG